MKTKAQDELLNFSSEESHSEDDEDGWKITEDVEKEFYKTLSQIKNKDPKIYKKDVEFFKDIPILESKGVKTSKSNPFTLRDYERKLVIEKGGDLSDEEPLKEKEPRLPTYVEEQESLKNSLKAVVHSSSEDEDSEEWGGLFKKRDKSKEEKEKEDETYKDWLKGQKTSAPDEEVERDMKPLRDYWTNPGLDEGDQFLRDYILNKKFLEKEESEPNAETSSESTDEEQNESKEELGHRFEEHDQEFIKRYPRVMENTLRRKNDHRRQKRLEVRERKLKEKEKKRTEIKKKQKLKKKEIEEKIEELKKLTGNEQLAFDNVLVRDFDLDEYDKAMKRLFNEEFYSKDDPNFKPSDDTGYEDTWNEGDEVFEESEPMVEDNDTLNCEDPNFNMDCDYDPSQQNSRERSSRSRRRKDKHRRTTVSEAVSQEKPKFDPDTHHSFQEYVDQYYAIDCEDFIGDLACRFKYRRTTPNSYGLTVEEILAADPKELERWCSIKRLHQLRPEHKEKGDVKVYKKKGADERLKRKIIPSLYKSADDENATTSNKTKENADGNSLKEIIDQKQDTFEENTKHEKEMTSLNLKESGNAIQQDGINNVSKSKKKKKKKKKTEPETCLIEKDSLTAESKKRKLQTTQVRDSKNKKRKFIQNSNCEDMSTKRSRNNQTKSLKQSKKTSTQESSLTQISDARLLAYGIKPKKFRNKLKYSNNS